MATDRTELLRNVGLFALLDEDDLERVCASTSDRSIGAGEFLFHEGEEGDQAYVVLSGRLEVLKASDRREVLLAVRDQGQVIGEMALLQTRTRTASVRARVDTHLVAIPKRALDDLLDTSPAASRAMFETLLRRMQDTNTQLRQNERMAQLGTMTAGVAHELNNPAAAVRRAAGQLSERLDGLQAAVAELVAAAGGEAWAEVAAWLREVGSTATGELDALTRSDAEADLEDWLDDHGVEGAWELTAPLVDAGVTVDDLDDLAGKAPAGSLQTLLKVAASGLATRSLAREAGEGSSRLSDIVGTLKSYAYLDRAPVQDVDVARGLDDTVTMLGHKTRHVQVVRDYADDVPTITALGTELNQVWTNLIDNACDSMLDAEVEEPTLTLRARPERGGVLVQVEDNGPGIAPENRARIFDSFFTTKAPGKGTGLGLQMVHRTIVLEHGGDLDVESEPGRTVFNVWLPERPPDHPAAAAAKEG